MSLPYWLDFDRPHFATLERDLTADVAIIGAGICGLKLARSLARLGVSVVILEARRVGEGASGRNQGCMTHDHGSYATSIARYTRGTARQLWTIGLEGVAAVREQIEEYSIDCDFEASGCFSFVRPDDDDPGGLAATHRSDHDLLREDGFNVELVDADEVRERSGSAFPQLALGYLDAAQFHSGKFVVGLAAGVSQLPTVQLFEGARVVGVDAQPAGVRVRTEAANVTADSVFLATNALAPQIVPRLERGLRAERGQVFVTEPLRERPCRGCHGGALAWWREIIAGDGRYRLLFGGGRRRDEPDSLFPQYTCSGEPHPQLESEGFNPSARHQARLDAQFSKFFPHLHGVRVTHRWGGLQSFTRDELPMLGEFDRERRIHGIAGLSGHGNCFADFGAEYLAGRGVGVESDVEKRYGTLIRTLLTPARSSAQWGEWKTTHTV